MRNILSPGKKVSKSRYRDASRRLKNTVLTDERTTYSKMTKSWGSRESSFFSLEKCSYLSGRSKMLEKVMIAFWIYIWVLNLGQNARGWFYSEFKLEYWQKSNYNLTNFAEVLTQLTKDYLGNWFATCIVRLQVTKHNKNRIW